MTATTRFDRDMLFACRYAYYCLAQSIVPDMEYDRMEKAYTAATGEQLPVGSSKKDDYTPAQRALAMYFLFRAKETQDEALL